NTIWLWGIAVPAPSRTRSSREGSGPIASRPSATARKSHSAPSPTKPVGSRTGAGISCTENSALNLTAGLIFGGSRLGCLYLSDRIFLAPASHSGFPQEQHFSALVR